MIRDEKAVMEVFRRILTDAHQTMCKKIAKWWIKAINPNKQTNHPYARGDEAAPSWWPERPRPGADNKPQKGNPEHGTVRHLEPDHLSKPGKELFQYCDVLEFTNRFREIDSPSAHTQSGHRS
jgi:hypothetical protein